jgi:integrase
LIPDNPAKWVNVGQRKIVRKQRALSVEGVQLLAEHLEEPARSVLILAVTKGVRIGELLGLRVEDLDLSRGTIKIQRSVSRGQVDVTKTEGSTHQVPIPPVLLEMLTAHTNGAALSARSENERQPANWLSPSEAGTPLSDRNLINRHIYPVSKKLGIPRFSWHSLRHTFSALGGNEETIPTLVAKQLLGHSKLSTTQKYMHELEDQKRAAMAKIEHLIWLPKKKGDGEEIHNLTTSVAQYGPVATVATR